MRTKYLKELCREIYRKKGYLPVDDFIHACDRAERFSELVKARRRTT
jgi:hypothetical protein